MSYNALPSAEVAQDFRDALQDLKMNSRPEITNLTVIAKENTEYAQAISRELEDHIRKTRPEWKLPALYVLDSIVKNVGTPYTVYLGRNLYSIFMGAYTLVDQGVRKAMEALLKTWKQPVPESLDPRPVFPPDVTREIENALIKYRTITLQHQQSQVRTQHQSLPPRSAQAQPYRHTPTPPQSGHLMAPNGGPQFHPSLTHPPNVPSPLRQYGTPGSAPPNTAPYGQPTPQYQAPSAPPPDQGKLLEEIKQLVVVAATEMYRNPGSDGTKALLKTLGDLQRILEAQKLDPPVLQTIAMQVARIGESFKPAVQAPQPAPPPVSLSPQQPQQPPQPPQAASLAALLQSFTPQTGTPALPPPPAPPVTMATATPPPGAPSTAQLSQLLQSLAPRPTPPPPSVQPPSVPPMVAAPPSNDLLASLRAAGLLGGIHPAGGTPDPRIRSPPPLITPSLIPSALSSLMGPPLKMETTSLRIPRPHLIRKLYDDRPDQCRQCGRRFPATEDGKKQKAAHMDWHFAINTRVSESAKAVVNRSWYIGEREWIAYRENASSSNTSGADDGASSGNGTPTKDGKKKVKEFVVPVPTDISQQGAVCPVCQEKFDTKWHEEMQMPVWANAISVKGRVYHKTCYDEVVHNALGGGGGGAMAGVMGRGRGGSARNTPTPERVLGKRKLDVEGMADVGVKYSRV